MMKNLIQAFLTLFIFVTLATLISTGMGDEYGPPMPSDEFIENAAEEYFNELKQPKFSPEDEKLYAGLVGYEIRKVHSITQVSSPRPKICISNGVHFIGHWEEGSYGAEVYGDRPIGSLDRFYDSNEGDYYWKFSMVGVVASGYSNMGFKPGWFINPDWEDKVYAWWCYSKDSDGRKDGGSYDGEDSVSDGSPLETVVGVAAGVAAVAGVGFFVKTLAAKKKTGSMAKALARPPPKSQVPAKAAPQVQATQQPYSEIDPTVRRWIENNPIYSGYWRVTPDGRFVTNELYPDYNIPIEWIKGTSTEPLTELFSTPVPNMEHSLHSSRIVTSIKKQNPELLDKLTIGSWKKLNDGERMNIVHKFADTIAKQHNMPSIKVELDPNLEYRAVYDWNSEPPRIQISPNVLEDPAGSIRTITHEFQHHLQYTDPEKLPGGTKEYVNAIKKNLENYIHPSIDPVRYAGQLWERDAENMAKQMSERISKAAYRQKFEKLVEFVWGEEGLKSLNRIEKEEAQKKLDKLFDKLFGEEGAEILSKKRPSKLGRGR